MRRLMALLAFAGALTVLTPAAHAAPVASGPSCGLAAMTPARDVGSGSLFTAVVWGGPVALTDSVAPIAYSGTLLCTVTVNGFSGCAVVSLNPTTGATTAGPAVCGYTAAQADEIRVCSQVDVIGGGTFHYVDGVGWTTSPGDCPLAATHVCDIQVGSPCGGKGGVVDPIVCPVVRPFFPPDGDVGFWDCPPYTEPTPQSVPGYAVVHLAPPGV